MDADSPGGHGDNAGAIRYYSKSLKLHENDVRALNNRGLAYQKLGKHDKARKDFEEALLIDPGFEQVRRNLEGVHPTK